MLTMTLLFSLARADVEPADTNPCANAEDGDTCTTSSGDDGTCADGECVATKTDNTICGVVGTAALPLVLAALLPALWRRRSA